MYLCCFRFEELKAQKEAEEKTKEEAQKKEELGEKHLILTNLEVSPYRRKQISYQFNTETHHFTDNCHLFLTLLIPHLTSFMWT